MNAFHVFNLWGETSAKPTHPHPSRGVILVVCPHGPPECRNAGAFPGRSPGQRSALHAWGPLLQVQALPMG